MDKKEKLKQDDIATLKRRIKTLELDHYNDQFLSVFKRIQARLINYENLTKI